EAKPQLVRYVRMPLDQETLRLERDLGASYWASKILFSRPLLLFYAALVLFLMGIAGSVYREYWVKLFSAPPPVRTEMASGQLVISSNIKQAEVEVDGVSVGALRRGGFTIQLSVGRYRVRLKDASWRSMEHWVTVPHEKVVLLEVLKPREMKKELHKPKLPSTP
ncbi:MAG: PEGA domain-containing protein, partial [Myxococcota bacterium]